MLNAHYYDPDEQPIDSDPPWDEVDYLDEDREYGERRGAYDTYDDGYAADPRLAP